MKGQKWYQSETVAEAYEDKRFSGGGHIIDSREKRIVLSALSPLKGKRVLEIACGTGRFTATIASEDANITGIDVSIPMLSQGREKTQILGVQDRSEFILGDAATLPFDDNTFDAVIAIRFLHLTESPGQFLSEMHRVARDKVVFDTFNVTSARSIYNWLLPMGSRLYSHHQVNQLVSQVGLNVHNVTHDFIVPYGIYRELPNAIATPLRKIDSTLTKTPMVRRLTSVSFWECRV